MEKNNLHILICPDSFKGSLSSYAAAEAIEKGCKRISPDADYHRFPLADGGEGTAAILAQRPGFAEMKFQVANPAGTATEVVAFWNEQEKTLLFDSAAVLGQSALHDKRDILHFNTSGIGQMVGKAIELGAKQLAIGLGGTLTCDAGIGMAHCLGYRFLDKEGKQIEPIPKNLSMIESIEQTQLSETYASLKIIGLYDVDIPLSGLGGAAMKYGSQKGANDEEKTFLDNGLMHFQRIVTKHFVNKTGVLSGLGAAGGLGFGMFFFANAQMVSGFEYIAQSLGFEALVEEADLVISGEGRLDKQTIDGKVIHGISKYCAKHNTPLALICGEMKDQELILPMLNVDAVVQICGPDVPMSDALARAAFHIEDCAVTLMDYLKNNE